MGAHSSFTQEKADLICERLAEVGSLRKVLREPGMPDGVTVRKWLREREEFALAYARAKESGIDSLVEEALHIVDEPPPNTPSGSTDSGYVAWAKERAGFRRWMAERMAPKKYGLKQDITSGGEPMQAMAPVFNITLTDKDEPAA
jgi:hypothetical protein